MKTMTGPPPSTPKKKFIGPLLPSALPPPVIDAKKAESRPDPQAELLKRKIAERQAAPPTSPVKLSAALQSLSQYADDDDSEDIGEKVDTKAEPELTAPPSPSKSEGQRSSCLPATPVQSVAASISTSLGPVSTQSFYASTTKGKERENDRKRRSPDDDEDNSLGRYARTPISHSTSSPFDKKDAMDRKPLLFKGVNPYNRMKGSSNDLSAGRSLGPVQQRYGKKNRLRGL